MFAISCEIDGRVPMNLYLFLEKARSTPHLLYVHKKWRVCGITHTFWANSKSLEDPVTPGYLSQLYPKGPVNCTQRAHQFVYQMRYQNKVLGLLGTMVGLLGTIYWAFWVQFI